MEKGAVPAVCCIPNAWQVMMEKGLSNPAVNGPTVSSSVRRTSDAYLRWVGSLKVLICTGSVHDSTKSRTDWVTKHTGSREARPKQSLQTCFCGWSRGAGAGWGHRVGETGDHATVWVRTQALGVGMEMMTSWKGICCSSVRLPKVLVFLVNFLREKVRWECKVCAHVCLCVEERERKWRRDHGIKTILVL